MAKRLAIAVLLIFAICVFAAPSYAFPVPIWSGTTDYSFDGGGFSTTAWTATITWEVYAPGTSYIGTSPYYVYYYTIKNTASTGGSITIFNIANPHNMPIYSHAWIDGIGITPSASPISPGQISWSFYNTGGQLDPGDTSDMLYMESTWPDFVNAGLQGSGGNDSHRVPGPGSPEPATMSLLGLGIAGLVGFRRKKRVF